MDVITDRKPMSLNLPNFSESGYLGTIALSGEQRETAIGVARQRQQIALDGNFQKVPKNAAAQWLMDLKGALAEVGFGDYLALVADLNGIDYELAELVSDKPVAKQDITLGGLKFDVKGCAALIDGLTERDDKLLIINCCQHDAKYVGYAGYFWVKTYADSQDIFYFTRNEVSKWKRVPGQYKAGDYYAMPVPTLH